MSRVNIKDDYFNWMYDLVSKGRYSSATSYRKLLSYLHEVEFTYMYTKDEDRAYDGINLRHRYALTTNRYRHVSKALNGDPCSVFEMILALAIRCENTMDDPLLGDRTGQWFWRMIVSLGLGGMTDSLFDRQEAEKIMSRFLNREYSPEGRGGLFTIKGCDRDLRYMLIWDQHCYYLDTMI